ncbi:DUF58 domain-containing protein [Cellulomonas sp. KRMCY2]|uniref:DUF58 domain-containing protein n=1 Tax=Cellulomonas sp. KRMCY2 TaxID=1304865 RepID=UPI00045EAC00|nr:DUF58 domain-containing protein [Cellulomonas sp. KRMCY2]
MPNASRLAHLRARLELPVTRRATGLLDGRHRSVLQGHGQDFDDLSLYTPGDDVGDIDWKSSARTGIPVIKRFVRQSNLTLVLAVDTGRTMAAASAGGEPKGDVVTNAATLIAYLARDRGDRVALVAADSGRLRQLPPRGGTAHLEVVLRLIERAITLDAPPSDLDRVLDRVAGGFTRRALVVLLTDEANPTSAHAQALRNVCTRHELLVLSVADADPLSVPSGFAAGAPRTRDVGDGWTVPAWLQGRAELQAAAAARRAEQAAERAAMLRRLRVHDVVVRSSDDVVPAMVDLLTRSRRARR